MQIKKYEAVNMQEAIKMVKKDLGSNAVILSTKNVKKQGGTFGMFSRPLIEVTAADDYNPQQEKWQREKKNQDAKKAISESFESEAYSDAETTEDDASEEGEARSPIASILKDGFDKLKAEMDTMKKVYDDRVKTYDERVDELKYIIKGLAPKDGLNSTLPSGLDPLRNMMIKNDVSEFISNRILEHISKKVSKESIDDKNMLFSYLHNLITGHVKVSGDFISENSKQKRVLFVGTTGVGKTTTIAKLAAEYSIRKKLKVGLITLDTYRIAAIEQIKIYADILSIPLDIAVSVGELKDIIEAKKDYDILLIDTAGRSYNSDTQLADLNAVVKKKLNFNIETHLVLNANSKNADLQKIVERFKPLGVSSLIFTKLDETSTYGSIFNMMISSGKPVSYLTTGQRVPEDIEIATPKRIADLVIGQKQN